MESIRFYHVILVVTACVLLRVLFVLDFKDLGKNVVSAVTNTETLPNRTWWALPKVNSFDTSSLPEIKNIAREEAPSLSNTNSVERAPSDPLTSNPVKTAPSKPMLSNLKTTVPPNPILPNAATTVPPAAPVISNPETRTASDPNVLSSATRIATETIKPECHSDIEGPPTHINTTSKDKWWMDFLPYLKGIYRPDFSCRSDCQGFTDHLDSRNGNKSRPNFSCKSIVRELSPEERAERKRPQLTIRCENGKAFGVMENVSMDSPIQTFKDEESKACLHLYINQHCYDEYPVPNIVHWVHFGSVPMNMKKAIGFYSIFTLLKPCLVLFHGSMYQNGKYMDAFLPYAPNMVFVPKDAVEYVPSTHVKIIEKANQADIARLQVLEEYGGIYLDNDEVILKPVDIFRATSYAGAQEGPAEQISNAVMFARPNHTYTKMWLKNYDTYNGRDWTSHSIRYISRWAYRQVKTWLLQAFGPVFIRWDWRQTHNIYHKSCSITGDFGAHIYWNRAWKWPEKYDDFEFIKYTDSTFGEIARYVFFGHGCKCQRQNITLSHFPRQ